MSARVMAAVVALVVLGALPSVALASGGDPPVDGGPPPVVINPGLGNHGGIGIGVHSPGAPGSGGRQGAAGPVTPGGAGAGSGGGEATGPCDTVNGAGLSAAQYAQLRQGLACDAASRLGPNGKPAPPSPAVLAQQAYGELVLPSPTIERSPTQDNSDPAFGGQSFTWVNLWTWYWTAPGTWRPLGKTVAAGGVSATVTARPVRLAFDPGDGGAAVSCAGPGRPWTDADGDAAPSAGGCGYVYRQVTDGSTPLTATVSIVWSVSWTSNVGQSGVLPQMATQAASSFIVEQIHDVNR